MDRRPRIVRQIGPPVETGRRPGRPAFGRATARCRDVARRCAATALRCAAPLPRTRGCAGA